jgi:glycosyltransferase involved in cell wall biosynthesis
MIAEHAPSSPTDLPGASGNAPIQLVLFFTFGVSLETWAETGLLGREIKLYHSLMKRGVRVLFITYGDRGDFAYRDRLGGIEVFPIYARISRPRTKLGAYIQSLFLPLRLRAVVKRADLLKTNQMWGSWVALLSGALFRRPVIVRCGFERYESALREPHSRLYFILLRAICSLCYRFADRIILASPAMAKFVTQRFHIRPTKIQVLPNYVDISSFRPLGYDTNGKLLFVGRLSPVKNIFALVDAVAKTDYELHIIGEGELSPAIEAHIRRVGAKAKLLGGVPHDELPDLINRYAAFVLPSLYEGHPKALLEAMACGVAVLGTDVPGIRSVIEDRHNGLLAHPDADSLKAAITTLMTDSGLRRQLGANARAYATEHCDLNNISQRELLLYHEATRAAR